MCLRMAGRMATRFEPMRGDLAAAWNRMVARMGFAAALAAVRTVGIPKSDGGTRPISIAHLLWRICAGVLVDLLTPQSFKFFTILGLGYEWLAKNPEQWEEEEDFNVAREFVKTVKVTNDVAERGVKMAADYATILTKDDKIRAMIMQLLLLLLLQL